MAVKNLQSVVCNVANQSGSVTNLDSKGYGVATYVPPAMSSPQYPVFSHESAKPGLRRERAITCGSFQAATRSETPKRWAGTSGTRAIFLSERSWAVGNQRFPGQLRSLAMFAADQADRDDAARTIRSESLAG